MKIKVIDKSYDEIMAMPKRKHIKPRKPDIFFRTLLKMVSAPDLRRVNFKVTEIGMERLRNHENALYLMNHSCFLDMEIVASLLYPRPFNIVTTSDAFVGRNLLLHLIGCIPTNKFATDTALVRDILYTVRKLKSSVVIFPEAGYSFDGTATVIPDTAAKLIKMLGIPVVMIRTYGAFSYDPLYNNLQLRRVNVSATEEYLLSPTDIQNMTVEQIYEVLKYEFRFDAFAWQRDNHVKIDEPFRADYLNRVLYKCPHCLSEGSTEGRGTHLRCLSCGKSYVLDEYGSMCAEDGFTEFDHIPDWYSWERKSVLAEILAGVYSLDLPVDICMAVGNAKIYRVGEGRLRHSTDGFVLDGCEGKLHYEQKPLASYTVCADFNWYEIGDVIALGNNEYQYYCFPKEGGDIVAKIRLAAEEIYKIKKSEKDRRDAECCKEKSAEHAKISDFDNLHSQKTM